MKLKQYLTEGKEDKVTKFFNKYYDMSEFTTDDFKDVTVAAKKAGKSWSLDNYIISYPPAVIGIDWRVSSREIVRGTGMSFFNFIQYMIKHKAKLKNISDIFTEK